MKLVIIEDTPEIIDLVSRCMDLRWPEVKVVSASQGLAGVDLVKIEAPDIVLLDVGLPDIDGFEVCRRIRLFSAVPVVMLTARDEESDKIEGLDAGADDYVTKPFSHGELIARLKAVLRRSTTMPGHEQSKDMHITGGVRIDFDVRQVFVDNEEVKLTPTEYNLLCLLAKNRGQTLVNRVILEKIWGSDYADAIDYLTVYIQRLRTKLGDDPKEPRLILSQRGEGYQLANLREGKPSLQAR